MTTASLFFAILGALAAAINLMKLVVWLDAPRAAKRPRSVRRSASVPYRDGDRWAAELDLERARLAA